jgi:hypothetical protein
MGIISSLASGIGSLVSGIFGGDDREEAARKASKQQVAGAQRGVSNIKDYYSEIQDLMAPWIEAGGSALNQQMNILGLGGPEAQQAAFDEILNSPYFEGLAQQGERAILQNASATGGLRGGNTQAILAQYRPQLAAQEIDRQYNRLGDIISRGYGATGQQAQYGYGTGTNVANLENQIGAYQAGGTLGEAEAAQQRLYDIGSGIGSIVGTTIDFFNPVPDMSGNSPTVPQYKPPQISGSLF